jgi:hypothetical protein
MRSTGTSQTTGDPDKMPDVQVEVDGNESTSPTEGDDDEDDFAKMVCRHADGQS